MSDPTIYVPSYSFSGWQATNPSKPLPAPQVDNELANISTCFSQTITALEDIRRSDGQLQNGIVTVDSLAPGLTAGFTLRGAWTLGVHYIAGDGVSYAGKIYRALVANDATNLNRPDVSPTTWAFLYSTTDLAGAMSIATYDPTGVGADVFARANHTGAQAISTVSGLQSALDTLTNGKLALAGGTMSGDLDLGTNDIRGVMSLNDGRINRKNFLINGDGRVNLDNASTAVDDAYAHDQHYALTQTAAIGISTLTAPLDGFASMMRLTQSQATAQRMGYAQIIEATDTYDLRGQVVTLGGKLRYSNAAAVRYAILEWTGTADAPISDVVNNWTSGTFTAGNFFINTTTIVRQVGVITPTAATVTDFTLAATIGSTATNVIVLMWTEGAAAQNSTLDLAWYLAQGDLTKELNPFPFIDNATEELRCQRFALDGNISIETAGYTTGPLRLTAAFPTKMRAIPTITPVFAYTNASSGSIDNVNALGLRANAVVGSNANGGMTVSFKARARL
jgi:hypothetical protein